MHRFLLIIIACLLLVHCSGRESMQALQHKMFSAKAGYTELIELAYYSDYFSFVGNDAQGRVAFALDNNGGQDGIEFQAEPFAVLHDEQKGWVEAKGSGPYANGHHELKSIPDSKTFQFHGTVEAGIRIESSDNQLALFVEPVVFHVANTKGMAHFRIGSAPAVLHWGDRHIPGRVIYEYLVLPHFNRLTRSYVGLWKDFHRVYLRVDEQGDFYFHSQNSELFQPLTEQVSGFLFLENDSPARLANVSIVAADFESAFGFYQWPLAWTGSFNHGQTSYTVAFDLHERITFAN